MIWIVGDLHGLWDPLKLLMTELRKEESRGNPVEKVIFLGDLVDHGPSSREVLEIVRDFPWPVVTLLGNHEQMMLDYLAGRPHFWFPGNGGEKTLDSFGFHPQEPPSEAMVKTFEPLIQWMETWPLIHREEFQWGGEHWTWYFTHAGFSGNLPLARHLELKTILDLPGWMDRHGVSLENTCLWSRERPVRLAEKTVVVSGHTPTTMLASLGLDPGLYDPTWGVPYLSFQGYLPRVSLEPEHSVVRWSGRLQDLHSILLDTGAVYGGSLTALGLSAETLEQGVLPLKVIPTGRGYRHRREPDQVIRLLT